LLTRLIKRQLILFGIITVIALMVLGWYYLHIPKLVGIGVYELKADLPASGGLYSTANVTYRGITIGKVTDVEPTEHGARATMSIDTHYRIPVDATANVHSVSAAGEQYLDLESSGDPGRHLSPGQTITKGTVPSPIGPALDAANRGLAALPRDKISAVLDETAQSVGGLGPALQRLVDATQAIATDTITHAENVREIIKNSGPILDSQVNSGDAIERWARNLNTLAAQAAEKDLDVKSILRQVVPTADETTEALSDLRDTLPQTLANGVIATDMLRRYNKNLEQVLVFVPQLGGILQTVTTMFPDSAGLNVPNALVSTPPPCLTGYVPASQWRSFADTSEAELPDDLYCKIPQDTPANSVRGVRNIPCVDVPGKRAPTPRDCRSDKPYIPLGTNPWYGDPNQIRNCPAPGARCDQPVDPGRVIPAPSINTGLIPLPADRDPGTPPPRNDPLSRAGSGTVQCNGQQPNPCIYTPGGPPAVYSQQSAEVVGPDGTKFSVENSSNTGDDGWKDMLAPAG
jgi:phospholipid/cholesterol/gamma-HCH transport system substrate-binding protein